MNNKTFLCQDFISQNSLDFFILTETWITPDNLTSLIEATPPNFTDLHQPQLSGRGGGVAVIYKEDFKCTPITFSPFSSFEHLAFIIKLKDPVLILVIYRPPRHNTAFIEEFSEFLSHFICKYDRILILGDFNVHVCCPSRPMTDDFIKTLNPLN